jgi:hypothetical protein
MKQKREPGHKIVLLFLFEVLAATSVKSTVFRVAYPCRSDISLGGIYSLHLQDRKVSEARYQQKAELNLWSASGFFLGLGQTDAFFYWWGGTESLGTYI